MPAFRCAFSAIYTTQMALLVALVCDKSSYVCFSMFFKVIMIFTLPTPFSNLFLLFERIYAYVHHSCLVPKRLIVTIICSITQSMSFSRLRYNPLLLSKSTGCWAPSRILDIILMV
ncbi:hypothetical protein BKA59DRAFT_473425 [Fusarium tricinctum]|uniref:Uncharacterized protein n=1 Tax=Fusarium tricinctum TaxID=61284 RepID=A0A8K0RXR6_9HYPO|nr:hypothetical protein BKA59DRAFT_473425 [Fusarium tricinctum]